MRGTEATTHAWSRVAAQEGQPGDLGEDLLGDVEVGGHALDVVEVLERLHEAQVLAGALLVELDRVLGDHRRLGALDRHARRRRAPGARARGRPASCRPRPASPVVSTSSAPASMAVQRDARPGRWPRATVMRPRGSNCQATAPDSGELAAGLGEHRADVGGGAVAVVGRRLDEDRHAARAVALVDDLLELLGLTAAGRLARSPA